MILEKIAQDSHSEVSLKKLLFLLDIKTNDELAMEKFWHHITILKELKAIACDHETLGKIRTMNGYGLVDATFRITHSGYRTLAVFTNKDTSKEIRNRLMKVGKTVTGMALAAIISKAINHFH